MMPECEPSPPEQSFRSQGKWVVHGYIRSSKGVPSMCNSIIT